MSMTLSPALFAHFTTFCALRDRCGHDVDFRLEANTAHAQGFVDTILIVDDEFLRNHVDHFRSIGIATALAALDHPPDVVFTHFPIFDRNDAVRVEAADVTAGDAGEDRSDLTIGHQLGFLDGVLDRAHGGVDVHHHALAQAARRVGSDADDVDTRFPYDLRR